MAANTQIQIPSLMVIKPNDRTYVRSHQAWLILASTVMQFPHRAKLTGANPEGPVLTHAELNRAMNFTSRRVVELLALPLRLLASFCVQNDLPVLPSIVVYASTRRPDMDLPTRPGLSLCDEQAAVWACDWYSIRVPPAATFRKVQQAYQLKAQAYQRTA